MAGHRKTPPRPAEKALREAYDEFLRTAAGFDRMSSRRSVLGEMTGGMAGKTIPGTAGDRLREEAATALKSIVQRAVNPGTRQP
jgi:hypothetical protein